ncbi:MAG TPA: MmcQ/YjbR family DNA-binding protein [Terriglobales bacterium]|nr:MmcQ/YjbR family DNA-binding protein [Terriglobales bacterium]
MNIDAIRQFCMSLPHATEQVQWVRDLVFKVGGKMFCVVNLEPQRGEVLMSFKATEEEFITLQEIEGIVPAPYMARNKWVALERMDALPASELKRLLRTSYELVFAKLPKKEQDRLAGREKAGPSRAKARSG